MVRVRCDSLSGAPMIDDFDQYALTLLACFVLAFSLGVAAGAGLQERECRAAKVQSQ